MTKYFITIAGNIGVGKTTLTTMLAEKLGWQPFLESAEENAYLADFYKDMARWSFHSQVFFLSRRLRQHAQLLQHANSVVQDRSVYEDAEIFARNLRRQGHMSERDWQTYSSLYSALSALLKPPNLVVYLKVSMPTLLGRIANRGRDYERSISAEYLSGLNELYDEWVSRFSLCPVLTIATDDLNYVKNEEHLDQIVRRIQDRLHGKDFLTLESA